jgi:signal peptidase II
MELFKSIKVINNFFYITYVQNEGAAFGIFKNAKWFFILLAVLAVLSIIRYIVIEKKVYKDEIISYSLLIGGIIGNLIDRIVYGYVIDYADFYIFGYNFPVFNIADACMVIGFILILYNLIVKGDRHEVNNSRRRSK